MNNNFSDNVIRFNRNMNYRGELPPGFRVINPYLDNPETLDVMERFYHKYYNDSNERRFILGINPGRYGAAVTGVPFTDTKHLESVCGIKMKSAYTHEPSAVFVHEMIKEAGGAVPFFHRFYINSLFPLAIVRQTKDGKWINANYYDEPEIFKKTEDFMISSLKTQIEFGLDTSRIFVLGKKNAKYVEKINKRVNLFDKLIVLEHPRYIQQYKIKDKQFFIDKYILELNRSNDDS